MFQHRRMKWLGAVCLVSTIACTKPNPKSCVDGICNDQSYPFCDVDGTLGGEAQECIAVMCTPSQFEACRDDKELRCNYTGTNYDIVQCELGCDSALEGCRLCEPDETRCTNGKVATCDTNGAIVSMEECRLGCFQDEPRCRDVDPSNGLAKYLDQAVDPPDVDLNTGGTINTTSGTVTNGVSQLPVPSFLVPGAGNSPAIRVLVVNNLRLGDVTVTGGGGEERPTVSRPALAVLAKSDIIVTGRVTVRAGDIITGSCVGGLAHVSVVNFDSSASGSGGGGNATTGAVGGSTPTMTAGAAGTTAGGDRSSLFFCVNA